MTSIINLIMIALILSVVLLVIYFIFKKDLTVVQDIHSYQFFKIDYLTKGIKDTISAIQNTNITELNLNKVEAKKREDQKAKLDRAVRNCCTGDIGQKEYLKEYIAELLQRKFNIKEETIDYVIPFSDSVALTIMDKFDILLYIYRKEYKEKGFAKLCEDNELDKEKFSEYGVYYSIDNEDIDRAYMCSIRRISYVEKLDIITQRIYQCYAGHGVIDSLREEKSIDGVAGGVSGSTLLAYEYMEELLLSQCSGHNRYDSIWIFYQGKPIRMEFMSFGTARELERVIHNLYRNNNPGWLSSLRGYIINDTKDGDRITCTRPPFSESFSFWIRKFNSASPKNIESLITHENAYIPIEILSYLVKGCMVLVITGEQNSGKTTLLKSLVKFIDNRYPIRTLENFYELWLSRLYPEKNIAGFKTTDMISSSLAISTLKKTDASVLIAGESADFATAAKVVELSLVGTKMTMSTNHAITTQGLIEYHTNAVMSKENALYSDDLRAEKSVSQALNFDIHMVKSKTGERYIERITEIIPEEDRQVEWPEDMNECMKLYFKKVTNRKVYRAMDIVVFKDGKYYYKNPISETTIKRLAVNLSEEEMESFSQLIYKLNQEANIE
jgi:pilus assembly protein CpaF